jgi:hypothetical protein
MSILVADSFANKPAFSVKYPVWENGLPAGLAAPG